MAEKILMPKLGFDMREGVLVRWVRDEGEQINKGDVIAEIETDKATVEVESPASGVVRKLLASPGDSIPVGSLMAVVGSAEESIEALLPVSGGDAREEIRATAEGSTAAAPGQDEEVLTSLETGSNLKASPLARKIAKDERVSLANIRGSGPGGRIVRRDVEAALVGIDHAKPPTQADKHEFPSIQPQANLPTDADKPGSDQIIVTSKLRQAIGRRLVESKQNLPHFYVAHEYKMDALEDLRQQINSRLPAGEKLSVNDFIVKATAMALRDYPNLNASINGAEIVQYANVNMGVAVTVPGGLLTVVVKEADKKPLRRISMEIKIMAGRAREGKVKPEDVEGSTFSTSNLGMYEVENFTAIINPPEAAILAIGSSREVAVVENGQIKIGNRMKCTLSVDHRISDGAEAAQFMQAVAKYLEDPLRLLL